MTTRRGLLAGSGAAFCAAALGACAKAAPQDEAASRKARSIAVLREKGVSYMEGLPQIETTAQVRLRSEQEIVQRAVCLFAVALAATANDPTQADELLALWGAGASLSPNEQQFLGVRPLREEARADFSWRLEAAVPLLWALNWLETLPFPSVPIDPSSLQELYRAGPGRTPIRLRSLADILDQADLIYRMHWALEEARLGQPVKVGDLNADVVPERHRALNWLIHYDDADWDDVTTDT